MVDERHADDHEPPSAGGQGEEAVGRRRVIKGLVAAAAAAVLGRTFAGAATREGGSPDRLGEGPRGGDEMAQATSAFHVVGEDDATAIWFLGTLALIKGHGAGSGGVFGVVEFTHPPGFATPLHVHNNEDEAFYVLDGAIRGVCDGREWSASRGGFVWLPRGSRHGYRVEGDEPVRTLVFSIPAGFERFVVEAGEPALARTLPPPSEPDLEKLGAAAARYGQEILGPLPL